MNDLNQFKAYCLEHKIPIITDDALDYILDYMKSNQVKNILEIGTAYGFSAIAFSKAGAHVDTFEKDEERILEAEKWIQSFEADVTLYPYDANTYEHLNKSYDLIFIDAAKGQYQKFFTKFKHHLSPGGVIFCDNLSFHDLKPENVRKRQTRNLLKRINRFKDFLMDQTDFDTRIMDLGDGLSISKKRVLNETSNNHPQP